MRRRSKEMRPIRPLCVIFGTISVLVILNIYITKRNRRDCIGTINEDELLFAQKRKHFYILEPVALPPNIDIFLVESSGRDYLLSRELCALESAAKNNPSRTVHYILSTIEFSSEGLLDNLSKQYSNINLLRMEPSSFFMNTPFQDLWMQNIIQLSKYTVSHLSDIMRFLLLYVFGGTYLDSDIIVLKELPTEFNYVGVEHVQDPFHLAVGFLHFHKKHPVLKHCIDHLRDHFDGVHWNRNGPLLLTDNLIKVCQADTMESINAKNCQGVKLLPPSQVYSIHYKEWKDFFDPGKNEIVAEQLKDSYIAHYWGKLSSKTPINQNTILFELAKIHCPLTAQHLL